jgi:hypothetical protein
MEQKRVLNCIDGRTFDITMSWNEQFKDQEKLFPIRFKAVDRSTGRDLKLPKEIATFAVGDPLETLSEKQATFYGGSRDAMLADWTAMAFRRVTDWINRGK